MKKLLAISLTAIVAGAFYLTSCNTASNENSTESGKTVHFCIKGKTIENRKHVYLIDPNQRFANIITVPVDSVDMTFSIEGDTTENTELCLRYDGGKVFYRFFVDETPLEVDLVNNVTLKGSEQNIKVSRYLNQFDALQKELTETMAPVRNLMMSGEWDSKKSEYPEIDAALTRIRHSQDSIVRDAVENNPDNFVPTLFFFDYKYLDDVDNEKIKALVAGNVAYKNSSEVKRILKSIEKEERQKNLAGQKFVDVNLQNLEGQPAKISDFCGKGKYVLIDIWASWCGPCRFSMPHLAETLETYKDKNFDILGISIDTDTAAWRKGVRDLEVSWNSLCIPTGQDGWENELTDSYGVEGVPTAILVSPDGEILSIDHPMNLIQNLDEYIK